ncbi:CLUMA_CG016841, isoform A [Clunio marinus]|uniref:CLUMA_CG016841, isoform A n=1 Tax=Clunio marinus TaxID=568069 RepID=A0A1J1ITQ2_9DIPT|nr:CLUMA_CG016841, isoform A [Clunio marinus]
MKNNPKVFKLSIFCCVPKYFRVNPQICINIIKIHFICLFHLFELKFVVNTSQLISSSKMFLLPISPRCGTRMKMISKSALFTEKNAVVRFFERESRQLDLFRYNTGLPHDIVNEILLHE